MNSDRLYFLSVIKIPSRWSFSCWMTRARRLLAFSLNFLPFLSNAFTFMDLALLTEINIPGKLKQPSFITLVFLESLIISGFIKMYFFDNSLGITKRRIFFQFGKLIIRLHYFHSLFSAYFLPIP